MRDNHNLQISRFGVTLILALTLLNVITFQVVCSAKDSRGRHNKSQWAGDILFLPPVKDLDELQRIRIGLEAKLRNPKPEVRVAAARDLGNLLDPRAIPSLNEALKIDDPELQQTTRRASKTLARFVHFTAQRHPGSFLFHPEPITTDIAPPVIRHHDESGNEMELTLGIWATHGLSHKLCGGLIGQELVISKIGGLHIDQRLYGGNLLYFLIRKPSPDYVAVYFTPTGKLSKKWSQTRAGIISMEDVEEAPVIEPITLREIPCKLGPCKYRLLTPGRLLIAKKSRYDDRITAVGEEFKDQSGGALSIRDWLLQSEAQGQSFLSAFEPDLGMFDLGRTSFVSTNVRAESQPLGTIQIAEKGIRLLGVIEKGTEQRMIRKERPTQEILIKQPGKLNVTQLHQLNEKLTPTPSKQMPIPSGAGFETQKPPSLRTCALVSQYTKGIWLLEPERFDDQIVVEILFDLSKRDSQFQVLFGEGSELRFRKNQPVNFAGKKYSGGGIRISSKGISFLQGTLQKSGESWNPAK